VTEGGGEGARDPTVTMTRPPLAFISCIAVVPIPLQQRVSARSRLRAKSAGANEPAAAVDENGLARLKAAQDKHVAPHCEKSFWQRRCLDQRESAGHWQALRGRHGHELDKRMRRGGGRAAPSDVQADSTRLGT
jgi:hypothetical protein